VIRGCGVNNDGAAKVGFHRSEYPNGQAAAIEMAHENPASTRGPFSYVRVPWPATPLGDPIEVAALTKAFQASTSERQFCAVGSVKSNIGHLDVSAGVVGLIKTALSLKAWTHSGHAALHGAQSADRLRRDSFLCELETHGMAPHGRAGHHGPRRAGVSAFVLAYERTPRS